MKVFVYGAGGHGRVVADALVESGAELSGFLDDGAGEAFTLLISPIVGGLQFLTSHDGLNVALGIGENRARARSYERIIDEGHEAAIAIHPSASVSRTAAIGAGCAILERAVVETGASVGIGVIINCGAVVTHDVIVGDFAHISPNVALTGGSKVGRFTHVGAGAVVLPGVEVGEGAVVGAGAVVTKNVPPGATVVGVPARILKNPRNGI